MAQHDFICPHGNMRVTLDSCPFGYNDEDRDRHTHCPGKKAQCSEMLGSRDAFVKAVTAEK